MTESHSITIVLSIIGAITGLAGSMSGIALLVKARSDNKLTTATAALVQEDTTLKSVERVDRIVKLQDEYISRLQDRNAELGKRLEECEEGRVA